MGDAPVAVVADQLRQRPMSGIATYTRGLLRGLRQLGDDAPPVVLVASRGASPDPLVEWGWPVRSSRLPGPPDAPLAPVSYTHLTLPTN